MRVLISLIFSLKIPMAKEKINIVSNEDMTE